MKTFLIVAAVGVGGFLVYRYVKIPGLPGSGASPFPGTPSAGANAQPQVSGWNALNTLAQKSPDIIQAAGDAFGGGAYGGGGAGYGDGQYYGDGSGGGGASAYYAGGDGWGGSDYDPYCNSDPYPTYA